MNYQEALDFIHGRKRFGIKPGLDRIKELLKRLGDPQKKLKFIHIAGTNGKGSTTAMTASIFISAGYKTGMYISPFVDEFCERIQINGEYISHSDLALFTERVKNTVDEIDKEKVFTPVTEFEIVTAIGMLYFAEKKCDIVVLEVGLGGRLDATNAIDAPLVSVITSISMDHTNILGDTLSKIAFEKCGIIKNGSKTVLYPVQQEEVFKVVRERTKEMKNPLIIPDLNLLKIISESILGSEFIYKGLEILCPLTGRHQIYNCITAIEACRAASQNGITITDVDIKKGRKSTKFIGRFEIFKTRPLIILDGGHNEGGIDTLVDSLNKHVKPYYKKINTCMGILKDKDYRVCIKKISEISDMFIALSPNNPRALPVEEIKNIAGEYCKNTLSFNDINEAVEKLLNSTNDDDAILVCGSLYLLSDIRKIMENIYK